MSDQKHQPFGPLIYPQAVVLILLSGIGVLLNIPPLIWHSKSKNLAACTLIGWVILSNLMNFVNATIWHNDRDIGNQYKGQGLCDVEAKLQVGSFVGISSAIAAIMRSLSQVMDTRNITLVPSARQKLRNNMISFTLCCSVPALAMALHYVVQNNRYYLITVMGCAAGYDDSWVAVVLIEVWPLIMSIITVYYCILLCIRMHRYKTDFGALLNLSRTTKSRFVRLLILSIVLTLVLLPAQAVIFAKNLSFGFTSYSFTYTHPADWGTIYIYPSFGKVPFDRWIVVATSYLVFTFFGLGDDAIKMYRGWALAIGLGRSWPGLKEENRKSRPRSHAGSGARKGWGFAMGSWSSFQDRARLAFHKRRNMDEASLGTLESQSRTSITSYDTRYNNFAGTGPLASSEKFASSAPSGRLEKEAMSDVIITKEVFHDQEKDESLHSDKLDGLAN